MIAQMAVAALVDDLDLLISYLVSADFIGFFIATYTSRIGEMFYALVFMTLAFVIYNRSGSLTYCAILFLVIGSMGFLAAAPAISPFAVLFVTLAFIFLIHRLVFQ